MNDYYVWMWIVIIAAVVIGAGYAVLKRFLQDRDGRRQLEGKEPFREFQGENVPGQDDEIANNDFEIEKDRMRSQNLPHV